ncbi:MAG: hypothetical protein KJO64_07195 [Bacteroidia bacterium]|nr:hypothetical protein [Bacteroidia bacterium]NND51358.1 hypothetical protein [Flavobacteriaceae bacterium]
MIYEHSKQTIGAMRTLRICIGFLVILMFYGCKKEVPGNKFIFVSDYCTTIIVGGVLGIQEKCFYKDEVVVAELVTESTIVIRIAEPSVLNSEPGPSSYQELLDIPIKHVIAKK